jgi:hypothetical protein
MGQALKPSNHRRRNTGTWITIALVVCSLAWLTADTATRPLSVQLRTHIRFCQKTTAGTWQVIDEAGPVSLSFNANLLEIAGAQRAESDFVWRTRTQKGHAYSVRLSAPADIKFNLVTGQFEAKLPFEVTLDGRKANITADLTTESLASPIGNLNGKRAQGIPGRTPATVTLVSANNLQLPGQAPIILVCREEYRLSPR